MIQSKLAKLIFKCSEHGYYISDYEGRKFLDVYGPDIKQIVSDTDFPHLNYQTDGISGHFGFKIIIKDFNRFNQIFERKFTHIFIM